MKKSEKLKKYYTKVLIGACYADNTTDHIEFLKTREIDWCYKDKRDESIIYAISRSGDIFLYEKVFEHNKSFKYGSFLQVICRASESTNSLECVKFIIKNKDKFENVQKDYAYNITSALRMASVNNNIDTFYYLLSLGANPKDWWVVYHTAKSSNNKMYEKLMLETLGLKSLPIRKKVMGLCNDINYTNIDINDLKLL